MYIYIYIYIYVFYLYPAQSETLQTRIRILEHELNDSRCTLDALMLKNKKKSTQERLNSLASFGDSTNGKSKIAPEVEVARLRTLVDRLQTKLSAQAEMHRDVVETAKTRKLSAESQLAHIKARAEMDNETLRYALSLAV